MARRVVPSASRALVFFFFFGPFSTCMTGKSSYQDGHVCWDLCKGSFGVQGLPVAEKTYLFRVPYYGLKINK